MFGTDSPWSFEKLEASGLPNTPLVEVFWISSLSLLGPDRCAWQGRRLNAYYGVLPEASRAALP
jgi:hypothetical protein